jgi:dihydrofolate reductase
MQRIIGSGLSMSIDGYLAGPAQSFEAPLGLGGERLHEWAFATKAMCDLHGMEGGAEGLDNDWARRAVQRVGATVMGRNMFGPVRGPWENEAWRGWWGEDPPFHHPVFVLTHHARPDLVMDGDTTFHFVTEGIDEAIRRARTAAGDLDVRVGGGAQTIRQCLEAGLVDELHLVVVPTLLGSGERLFDGLRDLPAMYECAEFESSSRVGHVLLRRRRSG